MDRAFSRRDFGCLWCGAGRSGLCGANTSLQAPSSLGLDAARQLYVLNASSIAVFAAGAKGNVKPKYLVSGGLTQLNSPQGIAVAPNGKLFVTNQSSGGGYITAYAPGSNGDKPPVQTIYDDTSSPRCSSRSLGRLGN
jgi:glucose/arabinose dehydrogenase